MRRVARVMHEVIAHFLAMDGILSNKDDPKTTPKAEESIVQLLTVKTAVTIQMAIVQDIISFDFRRKFSKEIDGVI